MSRRCWLFDYRRLRSRWNGRQHLLFPVDQCGGVIARNLEPMAVGDCVRGTGFHAVAAKYTSVVVDVVDLGVAFAPADASLFSVLRSFNVDTVGWAGGST